MFKLLVPFVVLLAAIAVTVLTDRPQKPADFTFVNRGDVTTLDVQKMSWMQDLRIGRAVFEGLTKNDIFSPGYDKLPGVAERWEVSEDGKTYTFFLRADAEWSNGEPVTAEHFVYAWRRALLPDTACDCTALFQKIRGGKAFYQWRQDRLAEFRPEAGDEDGCAQAGGHGRGKVVGGDQAEVRRVGRHEGRGFAHAADRVGAAGAVLPRSVQLCGVLPGA